MSIAEILATAARQGRTVLLEHELLGIFASQGLAVPRHCFVPLSDLEKPHITDDLSGSPGFLKVSSEKILHKSDVGGVVSLPEISAEAVSAAGRRILDGLDAELRGAVRGFVLEERVAYTPGLGRELLLGMRRSADFGTVFTLGFGGTYVEALSAACRPDQSTVLFHPELTDEATLKARLEGALFFRWMAGGVRGVAGLTDGEGLWAEVQRWLAALSRIRAEVQQAGFEVAELELNPLAWTDRGLVPVDALLRLAPAEQAAAPFPLDNLRCAVNPGSVALVGVSTKMNVGHIILRCMIEAGFPLERTYVVKEGMEALDGAPCVPSLSALPEPVDLLVLAVSAAGVPQVLEEALASGKVRSVLLIPGGMGETEGGKGIERQVLDLIEGAGARRPVLMGNNSLGLVSRPARFDSLFIPEAKLPRARQGLHNVALISQSGAFMITRLSKLSFLGPDYQISVGNQIDARLSHFLEVLADAEGVTTHALYIEGFKPGDGERLARVVRQVVASGRDVIAYKAGRSSLGQAATMGHTASVAGDYRVFQTLLADAGALVAETFTDFVDLLRLSATLHQKRFSGRRVAFLSNAGYETVGMADNHAGSGWGLEPATLAEETVSRIEADLRRARIQHLITVHNPLDITPMANDAVHEACIRALLDDAGVDCGVFANVPLTAMVQSLPHGVSERDVFDAPGGYNERVIAAFGAAEKPFVVVVDGGRLYDPMAHQLEDAGLPVFRSADQATALLAQYISYRLARANSQ